jgi:kynurenine formamidase
VNVLGFLEGVAGAHVYELAHPLEASMPVSPNHPGYGMALLRRHGDVVRADGGSASTEMIVLGGHTGTHLDALAHVSDAGKLYGGVNPAEVQPPVKFVGATGSPVRPIDVVA